ncbi:hypothetical protein NOCARDAX2BIS_150116 [Nocardioides sp. AX2bis]|nr:hypothetical protein NOCARDAX2BIS_150116 [Nocardioides sp. AX2bis]
MGPAPDRPTVRRSHDTAPRAGRSRHVRRRRDEPGRGHPRHRRRAGRRVPRRRRPAERPAHRPARRPPGPVARSGRRGVRGAAPDLDRPATRGGLRPRPVRRLPAGHPARRRRRRRAAGLDLHRAGRPPRRLSRVPPAHRHPSHRTLHRDPRHDRSIR